MPPKRSTKRKNSRLGRVVAIIPAAGSGRRMRGDLAKQFLDLDGIPLLAMTLRPFQSCREVTAIILVVPPGDVDFCRKEIVEKFQIGKVMKVIPGGKRRQDSVRLGLEATEGEYGLVLIHDGARPLIREEFIRVLVAEARAHRAVVAGIPVKETIKEVNNHREVVNTYDRDRLWLIQTPQAFRYEDILAAHKEALRRDWEEAWDDSLLVERLGIPVKVVEGSEKNVKVTTPHDLEVTRFLLSHG